jgi:RNA polymerase sigma-70 factor (ECF subfamily)
LQEADAWDVTQAVLTNISRWIGSFEYDRSRGRFRSWLGVVTQREMQRLRERAARPGGGTGGGCLDRLLDDLTGSTDPAWSETCNAHIFRRGLERSRPHFDENTWNAFSRTWLQHEPPQQVARQLGRTIAWVYQARYRVLRRLQAEVVWLSDDVVGTAG